MVSAIAGRCPWSVSVICEHVVIGQMKIGDDKPDTRSWRKAYGLALSIFVVEVVLLYRLYRPVFVNRLDYFVLIATILAIPLYGLWRTRGSASLGQYLKGDASIRWATIGLSVLATQAGPITFLSMPGQAYESGIGFIQNYSGNRWR